MGFLFTQCIFHYFNIHTPHAIMPKEKRDACVSVVLDHVEHVAGPKILNEQNLTEGQ